MKKSLLAVLILLGTVAFAGPKKAAKFPAVKQNDKIAVVAHRGFWKSGQGGFSENSIASLKAAQDNGFWGSECDIHLTSDGRVIVNHNHDIEGLKIAEHTFAELSAYKLPNGERRPSFEEYAAQAAKSVTTRLVVEIKHQPNDEIEKRLIDEAVRILKKQGIFNPKRILFISFSHHACEYIADKYPRFINQFLTSNKKKDMSPSQFAAKGINGIDYQFRLFLKHPEWVDQAKAEGMSVNVWTVNDRKNIQKMIDLGVDAITTNEPLLVRDMLGDREFRTDGESTDREALAVYRKIANQLISSAPEAYAPKGYDGKTPVGSGICVHYSVASAYVNALQIAAKIGDSEMLDSLSSRIIPFLHEKKHLQSIDYHVDHSIFGSIPLEIAIDRPEIVTAEDMAEFKRLGLHYADHQWEKPDSIDNYGCGNLPYKEKLRCLEAGYTPQTRLWIDDMYMINVLQTQAFRATGNRKYIDRAAREMALYLEKLQQPDGLFFHSTDAPFVWGRGDGWMAAGMPMILQYLAPESKYFQPIMKGYLKMMESLLKWQRSSGLWGQLVNDPGSWDETSCSAMFTYAFLTGVKNGWLDAKKYGSAAGKAWKALCGMLDEYGNLPGVCVGTSARNSREWYLERPRVNGDSHGQAPMLWICNALIH